MAADLAARMQAALASPQREPLAAIVQELVRSLPQQPMTHYARAELSRRDGDLRQALGASAAAIAGLLGGQIAPGGRLDLLEVLRTALRLPAEKLPLAMPYLRQFGELAERNGVMRSIPRPLAALFTHPGAPAGAAPPSPMHAVAALDTLGFDAQCDPDWGERVFEDLLVPWIVEAAGRGDIEFAMRLEHLAYARHAKRSESQAWFKKTTGRWIPGLAEGVRRNASAHGPGYAAWRPEQTRRVAFFVHNASMLAHVVVLIETLEAVREIGGGDYAFSVFVLDGRDPEFQRRLTACGIDLRYLDDAGERGEFARLLRLRRELEAGNFAACIWVSLVRAMAVAFALRIAPLQVWWAMKYHACDIAEIDARLAVENVVLRKNLEGLEWRTFGNSSAQWLDASRTEAARQLRTGFPADAIVAACIGREEKLNSPPFLEAVCELLRRRPEAIFLWSGRNRHPAIQGAFDKAGVAERARFVGWVDTKLYAQAIDLFLDSFPFPAGLTLKEAMAAGKPAVLFRCAESLETGVAGAITPIAEGTASAPEGTRERLAGVFTREREFDLYFCADTPGEYVEHAVRLAADPQLRAAAGAANRRYIAEFASDPRVEARKFLAHLDEMFATIPVRS